MLLYYLCYRSLDRGETGRVRALLEQTAARPRTECQTKLGLFAPIRTSLAAHLAKWEGNSARARALLGVVPPRALIRTNSFW